jgi:hypothetical protein
MLPYFASSGHNLYAKSAYVYLQHMTKLQEQHPDVCRQFEHGLHAVRRNEMYWAGLSSNFIIEHVLLRSMKTSGGLTRGRGMTETQRLVWLLSMPACAEVNSAMQELTGVTYSTSEQHKDTTQARQKRDMNDTQILLNFLQDRNPFSQDPCLRSIASGITAHSMVNVDDAEQIGVRILESMTGQKVFEYSFKKKNEAVTLASKTAVKIQGELVQIDPQLLFQRLVTAGAQCGDLPNLFKYELCSYPPALFESSGVHIPAKKPVLADAIWSLMPCDTPGPNEEVQYVLDGGYLLHRIPWPKGATYEGVCKVYCDYVWQKYGSAVIVFDGYEDGPSPKDCTHDRRGYVGPTVKFESNMIIQSKKKDFLANKMNKQRFINMLSDRLETKGCETKHAASDADLLIVQTAVASAARMPTVLIGEDTDLLVLLCYHASSEGFDIFFKCEPKQNAKKTPRVWNIKMTKAILGLAVCKQILFVHAILGCDTTSRLYGIGKGVALKKLFVNNHFLKQSEVFSNVGSTKQEIATAGEEALLCLYNAKPGEKLDFLRYKCFCEKVAASTKYVEPKSLPPTSAAAQQHSYRVYSQVQEWKGTDTHLNPENWGWKVNGGTMIPIMTDLEPAPKAILEIIRCNCKEGCSTMRCSCKKHGIDCSAACGNCRGVSCTNSPKPHLDEDDGAND